MEYAILWLPRLLCTAWLLPLVSFAVIAIRFSVIQRRNGRVDYVRARRAGSLAVAAIVASAVLSLLSLGLWLAIHGLPVLSPHTEEPFALGPQIGVAEVEGEVEAGDEAAEREEAKLLHETKPYHAGEWYSLVEVGALRLSINYYVDALTIVMFCLVTVVASCVHIYALGYMADELADYSDSESLVAGGEPLFRVGRFHRFFQYLSLFSFSMLGLIIAGNLLMVFVFWELVGICSYFLIGFYFERPTATNAANKAFLVNRVGDFGMLIGMMALWASLGTFNFGDTQVDSPDSTADGEADALEPGIFTLLRPASEEHRLTPAVGMAASARPAEVARAVLALPPEADAQLQLDTATAAGEELRSAPGSVGYWLLCIAGVGVFCGCVGKSAQVPLHVWLSDAMEGPTPVSALVHSATMVAAGVYLVGRFYPAMTPEALLIVAYVGAATLIIAATIAVTAVDIKRVLAYSTISQLGYMMLALGIGGYVAGLFHLVTHAFFKSLLFLCSGSVIHGVHTNDMREMGGLRSRMPITAYTMLVGCLAIIGAGLPVVGIGLSGYYSKDVILEQAFSFTDRNPVHGFLLLAPVFGAALTAFYMFRLWFMTFAGAPRDEHRHAHAHESPRVMTGPLVLLALFAIGVGWGLPLSGLSVSGMLEQSRPDGMLASTTGVLLPRLMIPSESLQHDYVATASWAAFLAALVGVALAAAIYLWRLLDPAEIAHTFRPAYALLRDKWYFDELYRIGIVRPIMRLGCCIQWFDRRIVDAALHGAAALCRAGAFLVNRLFDGQIVDPLVNGFANWTWNYTITLRSIQTGSLRQYVVFIAAAVLVLLLGVAWSVTYAM